MLKSIALVIKTPLGLEEVVKSRILLEDPSAEVIAKPHNLAGLVVVERCSDPASLASRISTNVPEAENVVRVELDVETELNSIISAARELSKEKISPQESFAVRTVRRAAKGFTSIEVNAKVGAAVQEVTGARVDLDNPDKVVIIEVVGERTGIAIIDGSLEWRKMRPGKYRAWNFFRKVSIIQMPYLGSLEGAKELGRRVGRFAQAFEVGELVISPAGPVNASELVTFISGVEEGVKSRLDVQRRVYARYVKQVNVVVQDLYQLVLERRGEPLIVFEPEGEELYKGVVKISNVIKDAKRINLFFGAREGIPKGVFRLADKVLDLCPDVTLPTELAAPSALIALYTALRSVGSLSEDEVSGH